jgi:hypothetical protein
MHESNESLKGGGDAIKSEIERMANINASDVS